MQLKLHGQGCDLRVTCYLGRDSIKESGGKVHKAVRRENGAQRFAGHAQAVHGLLDDLPGLYAGLGSVNIPESTCRF